MLRKLWFVAEFCIAAEVRVMLSVLRARTARDHAAEFGDFAHPNSAIFCCPHGRVLEDTQEVDHGAEVDADRFVAAQFLISVRKIITRRHEDGNACGAASLRACRSPLRARGKVRIGAAVGVPPGKAIKIPP